MEPKIKERCSSFYFRPAEIKTPIENKKENKQRNREAPK